MNLLGQPEKEKFLYEKLFRYQTPSFVYMYVIGQRKALLNVASIAIHNW